MKPGTDLASEIFLNLKGTQFMDIGEFSRPVHAEMAALIDAARRGVARRQSFNVRYNFSLPLIVLNILLPQVFERIIYLEPYPEPHKISLWRRNHLEKRCLAKRKWIKLPLSIYWNRASSVSATVFNCRSGVGKKTPRKSGGCAALALIGTLVCTAKCFRSSTLRLNVRH